MMKSNDEFRKSGTVLLLEMANTWSVTRAVLEHEQASTAPTEQPFSEREMLTLCLAEQFEGSITATTLCKTFGLHHSQVGKMVDGLIKRELLKKSTKPVSRKSGQGTPLYLSPKGKEVLKEIKLGLGRRFAYLIQGLNADQLQQLKELIVVMHAAANEKFEERVFGKPPALGL